MWAKANTPAAAMDKAMDAFNLEVKPSYCPPNHFALVDQQTGPMEEYRFRREIRVQLQALCHQEGRPDVTVWAEGSHVQVTGRCQILKAQIASPFDLSQLDHLKGLLKVKLKADPLIKSINIQPLDVCRTMPKGELSVTCMLMLFQDN